MKRILFILCTLFCWVGISCEDILDKEPLAQISSTNAYQTAADAERALTAAYHPLTANNWCCGLWGNSGYMHWVMGNVASDDTEKGGESGSDQLYAQQISLFNIPADNDATRFAWSSQYIGVRRANLVLDNIPEIEMDPELKERILAEAKFLRAWYYMNLVKTFGGVPLVLSSELESYDLERSSREEVYAQIIQDLEDAIEVLPAEYDDDWRGRATKGAAMAYLGKAYLYMDNFQEAYDWFGRVIDSGVYSLDPNYTTMFFREGENSPEHIFQVQFVNDQGAQPANNQLNIVFGSRARNGWGFNLPTQDFVDAFEEGDPRLDASVYSTGEVMPDGLVADVGNSTTGYLNQKYYVPEYERVGGALQAGRDDIYMRLGKVLLWYAEAANEIGQTDDALRALNLVRARARAMSEDPNILTDITETNQAELREIIWHEQRVEFGQEFERFFELVRQDRAAEVLHAYAEKYNTAKGAGYREGVNEVFPIPQTEINLSDGRITQNPGY